MAINRPIGLVVAVGIMLILVLFSAKYIFLGSSTPGNDKTISSTGTSELIVEPDTAEIYLKVEVLRSTAEQAAEESKVLSNAVVASLKSFSGAKVETTGYNIFKREDWSESGSVFKGYQATYNIKVTTSNFDDVGKMIDDALSNGANGLDSVQFVLSKSQEEKTRAEALKLAGESARMKAEAVAAGAGVKLGDVLHVSESNFYSPPIYFGRAVESVAAGGKVADLQIEPTSTTVTASVTIAYRIK